MRKQSINYKVLGIMSGTSFDGIDLCLVDFNKSKSTWNYNIIGSKTALYSKELKCKILDVENAKGIDLIELHFEYGKFLGELAAIFLKEIDSKADLIASHGHTIFHQVDKGITFQLGNGASIAGNSKITTVSDFRSLDVALGGEGAPLVPFGDEYLFPEYDCCLNIGGIANISFKKNNERIAYDIAPANMILNHLFKSIDNNGEYDYDGKLGRNGRFNETLFNKLNQLNYYSHSYPKSIGKEWVIEKVFPILNQSKISKLDKLNSYYKHLAYQIAKNINANHVSNSVLTTGGGTNNSYLVELINNENINLIIPRRELIDYKEAIIFAFLGLNRYLEKINTLKSVTGASKDSSGGAIYFP